MSIQRLEDAARAAGLAMAADDDCYDVQIEDVATPRHRNRLAHGYAPQMKVLAKSHLPPSRPQSTALVPRTVPQPSWLSNVVGVWFGGRPTAA